MEIKNSFLADAINTLAELGKKAAEPKKGRHQRTQLHGDRRQLHRD